MNKVLVNNLPTLPKEVEGVFSVDSLISLLYDYCYSTKSNPFYVLKNGFDYSSSKRMFKSIFLFTEIYAPDSFYFTGKATTMSSPALSCETLESNLSGFGTPILGSVAKSLYTASVIVNVNNPRAVLPAVKI